MACDLQGTLGNEQKMKIATKIWRFDANELIFDECPFIVGMAGSINEMMEIVDFFHSPDVYKRPPPMRMSVGLVLTAKGQLFHFSQPHKWMAVQEKFHAVGSGSLVALGAMHSGATPKEAVLAATKVDPMTGMGTKVLKF